MPARVKPSFLARAKRFLRFARPRGGAKFQPPPVMVIGVQPFEVWRAPVLHSSLLPLLSLSSFSLFLSPGVTILRARTRRILKFRRRGGERGFRIAREITALDNAFACQLARGWADRDQIREISDPSFSAGELKKTGEGGEGR